MALGNYGRLWRTSRKVRLLCPWARHLTGRPIFMWQTGDTEMATPKRVRTHRPKYSDTLLSRKWRINMANKKKKNLPFISSTALTTRAANDFKSKQEK